MLPWYSLASAQMANNLIKWWRTKFLNGYKQFSVVQSDCSDGRPSDTEELLGHVSDSGGAREHGHGSTWVNESALPTCNTPPPPPPPAAAAAAAQPCGNKQRTGATASSTQTHIPPGTQQSNNNATPTQPPPPNFSSTKHLNLEEFSCDVSMEGGIYRDGQERQEFSFTLYDFDGHGKITKDDIAGLVTTIYETLGSSVKVPHYGSKTIKVKLTVSPDQRKRMSATVIDHKSPSHDGSAKQEDCGVHIKRDLNVTIKDTHRHRRHCRRQKIKEEQQQQQQQRQQQQQQHTCCNFTCKDINPNAAAQTATPPVTADASDQEYSDHYSRMTEDEMSEDEGECSEDQMPKHPSCEKIKTRRYQKHTSPRHHTHMNSGTQVTHVPITSVLCTKARKSKKRSSSLQRKELLEIIQANMDKNSHGFQTFRKQCPNHVNIESERTASSEHRTHRHKHKISRNSTAQLQCLANIVNSDNCYLDFTEIQGSPQNPVDGRNVLKGVPYCQYDKLLGAVVCMSNKQINTSLLEKSSLPSSPCHHRRHYRSRSHDLSQVPFRYNLIEPPTNIKYNNLRNGPIDASPRLVKKANARLKAFETEFEQTPAAFKKNIKKFPQVVLGHTSSPHHLKHRNRQEDQARAMAQVVRWLEQEFSSNVNMNGKTDSAKTTKSNATKSSPQQSSRASPNRDATSPSVSAVERHEHHHVHEHIHHHYHHYQESPVVV